MRGRTANGKTPRDFIFDNLLSMSAYWACTGAIIASLTAYYGFHCAVQCGLGLLRCPSYSWRAAFAYERTTRHWLRFLRLCNGTWRVLLPLVFFGAAAEDCRRAVDGGVMCWPSAFINLHVRLRRTGWWRSVEGRVRGDYYSVREMFSCLHIPVCSAP